MSKSFNPANDISELTGKTIIVTGGNAGLGAETVKAIAAHSPTNLFLCARTASKADAFITELRKKHPETTTRAVTLDLASFDSIKSAAAELNKSCDKIDVLILNAGVSGLAPGLTKDGYEIQTGTNHVGHALFTQLLMPKVLAASKQSSDAPRIVVVSSRAGQDAKLADGLPINELKTPMAKAGALKKYQLSKLANIYFAQSLAKQYPTVTTIPLHPGVVFTEIWGKANAFPSYATFFLVPVVKMLGLTAEQGAKNQLWCSFAKGAKSGQFYDPVGKEIPGAAPTHNTAHRDALWNWTNKELAAHGAPGWPAA